MCTPSIPLFSGFGSTTRLVYIVTVANRRETYGVTFLLQLKSLFFGTIKKKLEKFVSPSCMEGRGQNMRGSGQDMMQNDQTQRASVYMMQKEHIPCRNYESAVEWTLHVRKCNFAREWCGMVQTCNPSWQIWLGGWKMFVCMWVIIFNEWNNFLTVSSISFVSSKSFSPHNFCVWWCTMVRFH